MSARDGGTEAGSRFTEAIPTRRQFIAGFGATALSANFTLRPTGARGQQLNSNTQIVDISQGAFFGANVCKVAKIDFYKRLAERGVRTVIRYYSTKQNLDCKNITAHERSILHDHGFSLGIVYQWEGRRPGRYTAETGNADSAYCLTRVKEINQPEGSAIYFGIDADTATHNPEGVVQYFAAIQKVFRGRFQVGCYGAGENCKAVLERGLASFTWVAEAPAWQGTRAFMNSGKWTLYQNKSRIHHSEITKPFGVEIDTNIINPSVTSIGAFARDNSIVHYSQEHVALIASRRMWVNRDTLPLFDKPNGKPFGHVCIARMIHVLARLDGGWVNVDVNEDGRSDGYCEAKHLLPLPKMPIWNSRCKPSDI